MTYRRGMSKTSSAVMMVLIMVLWAVIAEAAQVYDYDRDGGVDGLDLHTYATGGLFGDIVDFASEFGVILQNADLTSLVLSNGTLTPSFDPAVTSYDATLSGSGEFVVVTATAAENGTKICVQERSVASGAATDPIPVLAARMKIKVSVKAADDMTVKNYEVSVRLRGWQLNEGNTGLAGAGIDRNSLPLYVGPDTPAHGTVISLKKITTPLVLVNGNITLDRCWIQPAISWGLGSILWTYDPTIGTQTASSRYSSTIVDSDIDGSAVTDSHIFGDCAFRGLATLQRNNLWGMGSGICIFGTQYPLNAVVEQNYVHDLRAGLVNGTLQSHNESATIRSFTGTSLVLSDNRFISKTGFDSGALFIQAYDNVINHSLIEGNLFESFGWCIPLEPIGFGYGTDMKCMDNRFVRIGYGPAYVNGGPGWAEWTDNYYDDPAFPDHKGNAIPKP